MRRFFYQSVIILAATALGTALAWGAAHSPLSIHLATLLAGNKGHLSSMVNLLIYMGMVAGVLMTLGALGGLFTGVVLARRVSRFNGPSELKAA